MRTYFWLYLFVLNIITFIVFGYDKFRAVQRAWRVRERTLFGLTLIGGFFGALLGMIFFGHKTTKSSFQLRFRIIIFAWILLMIFILVQTQ